MVKTTFLHAIHSLTNIVEQMRKLYNMGIDIMESPLVTNAEDLAMLLLSEYYNEEGRDWFNGGYMRIRKSTYRLLQTSKVMRF